MGAFDENGIRLQVSREVKGTTARYSFEKSIIGLSLLVAGVLLVRNSIFLWQYHPQNYFITIDGDLVFQDDDNLSMIIDNQQENLTKIIKIYGYISSGSHIFSSPLVEKGGLS